VIFWNTLVRFDKSKIIPWIALRNTVGVLIPLAAGAVLHQPAAGAIIATGALNVSYSDSQQPYRQRARRMLTATCCVSLAVAAGGLLATQHLSFVALTALAAFATGMMGAVNQTAADLGVTTLATMIVFAAQAMTPTIALESGLIALGGGLLQTLLAVASWTVGRYSPEQRALSTFYGALARGASWGADALASPDIAPAASTESTEAQRALETLNGDSSVEAERYLTLLNQAERIRLSLLAIARLRVRLSREADGANETAALDEALAASSRALGTISEALRPSSGKTMSGEPAAEASKLDAAAEQLRASGRAIAGDARWQLNALAGQLRAASELAFHSTAAGRLAFEAAEAAAPRPLRLGSALARIRANLNLDSAVFRHAIRMAACVALGEAINRVTGVRRGYWLPMTVAIILRPDFTATFARGLLRLAGTLVGLVTATAITHFLQPSPGIEILLVGAFVYLMRCFGPANYGIFVTALTGLVVFLIAITGVPPGPAMLARGANTLVGGVIALLAYAVWPTWERRLMPESMASLLEAYGCYFEAIRNAYLNPGPEAQLRLDRARVAARLARSNTEASVTRLLAEPRATEARFAVFGKLLADSHRFVLAEMSLEAGIARSAPAPVRAAFLTFSDGVILTLKQLAAALRGVPLDRAALPDLREMHRELVHAGDPHFGRHALVNAETDRLVNSLNTITGLVAGVSA
jgi:uncharacterized membrane protein YccC